jgi:hypothetical protein
MKFQKDSNAILDYVNDWTTYLGTDTIVNSIFLVDNGITVQSTSNTGKTSTVWLSGGQTGITYKVTNRITTAQGRTDDRSFFVAIVEK